MTVQLAAQPLNRSDITGYIPQNVGNIVGGGDATLQGGGDNMIIVYSPGGAGGGAGLAQQGRTARFGNTSGDGLQVEYQGQASSGHGREAWMVGGGDNAEVIYISPTRR